MLAEGALPGTTGIYGLHQPTNPHKAAAMAPLRALLRLSMAGISLSLSLLCHFFIGFPYLWFLPIGWANELILFFYYFTSIACSVFSNGTYCHPSMRPECQ